jgi:small-conductance mechanosensitive channel
MKKELEIIFGAQELVAELAAPLAEIDGNLKGLYEKKAVLEGEIEAVDNQFSVESVTETMSKRQEIAIVEGIIKKAEQERARIIECNHDMSFEGAQAIIHDHRAKVTAAYQEEYGEIAKKAAEIRDLYADLRRAQADERNQFYSLLDELSPYLEPKKIGAASDAYSDLMKSVQGGVFDAAPAVSDLKPTR